MKKLAFLFAVLISGSVAFGQTNDEKGTAEVKIKTSAICGMCKMAIEKDLGFEKGVKSSDLNLEDKVITVVYNPAKTNVEKIKKAISKVGYDAEEVKADDKAYDKLPGCCKKDATPHKD